MKKLKVNGHVLKPYTAWHLKNGIVAIVTEVHSGDVSGYSISGIVHVHAFMDSDQPVGVGKFHWDIDGKDTSAEGSNDDWSLDRPVLCGEAKYFGMAEMLLDPPSRT